MHLPPLLRKNGDRLSGTLQVDDCRYDYNVTGPFGTGYGILVKGPNGQAELRYSRDYAAAEVSLSSGRYEMSDLSAYDSLGRKVFELAGQFVRGNTMDGLLVAVFAVNHHFWRKTGPFAAERS